ncbi:MAG: hypothetical protein LBI65_01180 [Candidatus Symbiothrix sp.]|jgi:hypothetical protein|nr:hypothetical protein [Candidatus Symbiothrix sp.]
MKKMKKLGNIRFVDTAAGTYGISMSGTNDYGIENLLRGIAGAWDTDPLFYGSAKVVPYGPDNNLPANIRNLLEKNNLGPGILDRKTGLQYGSGPFLYRLKFENNEILKEWTEDAEVQAWLNSWNYREFARNALHEFNYMRGFFARYYLAKGSRIGYLPRITRIECEHSNDCRLEWPADNSRRLEEVANIFVGDFESLSSRELKKYPVFDETHPGRYPVSMKYHSYRSFARYFYAVSSFFGSIPWVRRANDIPDIIRYLTDNMIAAAYHIHEPEEYWNRKENLIRDMNPEWDDTRVQESVNKSREELTRTIANILSGKRNAGKFFESIDFVDENGNKCEWKIEPIEMNIDKYIEAQAQISRIADSSTTSGFGLNPALSNIIIDGKGDSGSQMLYALKIFYAADAQIAEDIVFEPVNTALRINFPGKHLSMGFYRHTVNKEDNVPADKRTANNI